MAANTFKTLGTVPGSPYGFIEILPNSPVETVELLISLHGIGERGNGKTELVRLERNGLPYVNKKGLFDRNDLIAVCPQQPTTGDKFYWGTLYKFMLAMVKFYKVSPKIHLAGLSMGAHSIDEFMKNYRKAWAMPEFVNEPKIEIVSVVSMSGVGNPANAKFYPPAKLWTVHGLKDPYTFTFSRDLAANYNSLNLPTKAKFDPVPFLAHDTVLWNSVYADDEIYDWMLKS